jgi:uncharacterized OsmC-like protein
LEDQAKVKIAFERTASLFRKRASLAKSTNELKVRLRYGLPDEIEGMGCKLVGNTFQFTDGENAALRPGYLGLAGLGLCLARGYMARFAKFDIAVNGIEVSLRATIDLRRAYSVSDDIPAGCQALHCHVEVDSEVDEDRIIEVIDETDSHSPWLENFTQPHSVTRDVKVERREAEAVE